MSAWRIASHKLSGGMAKANIVDHGYFLKPMPGNPYLQTVHDGTSVGFNQGFSKKPLHWIARFRYNLLPVGMVLGPYSHNPLGKEVHWLEVSTMEKFRVRATSEEGSIPLFLVTFTVLFTIYHMGRLAFYHPDLTLQNVALGPSKQFVQGYRANKKNPIDKRTFRFFARCPELYFSDPFREFVRGGVIANDPYLEYVRKLGREAELLDPSYLSDERWAQTGGRGRLVPTNIVTVDKVGHNPAFITNRL